MTPDKPSQEEVEEALGAYRAMDIIPGEDTPAIHYGKILVKVCRALAQEVMRLKADCEKHVGHEHCVTPCDSLRIQDSNHSAWLVEKERAEKAEALVQRICRESGVVLFQDGEVRNHRAEKAESINAAMAEQNAKMREALTNISMMADDEDFSAEALEALSPSLPAPEVKP